VEFELCKADPSQPLFSKSETEILPREHLLLQYYDRYPTWRHLKRPPWFCDIPICILETFLSTLTRNKSSVSLTGKGRRLSPYLCTQGTHQ